MGLGSAVKDCWNGLGQIGRVGALTTALLLGGFVSSLYAQEEIPGMKPKDIPKYQKKYEEEKAKKEAKKKADADKKKETPGSGGPGYVSVGKTGGSGRTSRGDNYGPYGGGRSASGTNDFLTRAFWTHRIHDRSYNRTDNYAKIEHEYVGSRNGYYKLDLESIMESSRIGDTFQGTLNAFGLVSGRFREGSSKREDNADLSIGLFLDDLGVGKINRGGSGGIFLDSDFFDIFLKPKILYTKNVTLRHYEDPFPHEGVVENVVDFIRGCELGLNVGDDFGLELSGYASIFNQSIIRDQYPFSGSASGMAIYEIKDHEGSYKFLRGSLFWRVEDYFLLKIMGGYANRDQEYTGEVRENDGTVLFTYDKHKIYENRVGNFYLLFPFQSGNKNKHNFFSIIDLRAQLDDNEEEYEGSVSFIIQSKNNPMAFLNARKGTDVFDYEEMENVRKLQKFGHNNDSAFFYRFGFGFLSDNPQPGASSTYDRSRFVTAHFDAWINTKAVNFGGFMDFWFDTSSSHHPGKLKVGVGFYGTGYLFAQYEGIFRDFDDFVNKGRATHEVSVGAGVNF